MAERIGTLVIFGAGGDLAKRLLMPGLGDLLASGRGGDFTLVGVDRESMTDTAWRKRVTSSFAAGGARGECVAGVVAASRYLQADVTDSEDLRRVIGACTGTPALYFALPPHVTIASCAALENVELPEGTVFGLEKPFGTDLTSATALNRQLLKLAPERDIHRIDHFLGKATVLNLLGLRFANRIFEAVWNADNIERVELVFDEQLALEGRAGYYDKAGALVDMIQSHLLLVTAIVAMEPPSSLDADDLRGSIAQALRATKVWDDDAAKASRRARYVAGKINAKPIPPYVKEDGVDPARDTETLTEVTLAVDNWRWAGVPFVLRSGKALAHKRQEIVVTFKDVPHLPTGLSGYQSPPQLRIALTPDCISLDLNINGEGNPFTLDRVALSTEFAAGELAPYGEVLSGILAADPTLSVRADAVEECWRIIAPILAAWKKGAVPMEEYRAGSDGPLGW
ncbi:MAG: glucose-6-phosphate dehydrogenase [Lacisediminihabitans sp.]